MIAIFATTDRPLINNMTSPVIVAEDSDCAKFAREDFLYLAKMAEQCERYDEMLGFVRKFVAMTETIMTPEEKHVFAAAYKNAVGNRRAEIRVLTVIEQKEQRKGNMNEEVLGNIGKYKKIIEGELVNLCYELISLIDDKLIQMSKSHNNEIYFKKMKGDYYRYLAELMSDSEDNTTIIDSCTKCYAEANMHARSLLPPTHPLRLGLQLNMSVFEYEIQQRPNVAIQIATQALDEAFANIDKIKEENFKESTLIMQLLRDNLTLWNPENTNQEQ